jgi:hypothetical protein
MPEENSSEVLARKLRHHKVPPKIGDATCWLDLLQSTISLSRKTRDWRGLCLIWERSARRIDCETKVSII